MPRMLTAMGLRFALLAFSFGAGCQLINGVRAEKMVLLTWFEAPAVSLPNLVHMERTVTATALFLDRKGGGEPQRISGGFAGFFGAGKLFAMSEQEPGVYVVTSRDGGEPELPYDTDPNHRYGFKACTVNRAEGCIGEEYTLNRILAAPALDPSSIGFEPALLSPTIEGVAGALLAGSALTVRFPPPSEEAAYRPVVSVLAATLDPTQPPGLVFNSVPTSGQELMTFVTEPPPQSVVIPADKLSAPGLYVVLTGSARINTDRSENLFIGSGAIACAMNAFLIEVQAP